MKKIYLIYVLAFVLCSAVQAQPILQGADQVKNLQISRNNNNVSVAMDVDISNIEVGADETLILVPTIENGSKSLELPGVEIMGRFRGMQCGVKYAEGFRMAYDAFRVVPRRVLP